MTSTAPMSPISSSLTTPPPANRKLLSEGVIGLSLCLGLHFMFADPLRRDLASARAEITALQAARPLGSTSEESLPRAMAATENAKRQAESIHHTGLVARDEGALFAGIMELAESHGVRIDQMAPRQEQPGIAQAPPAALATGDAASATPSPLPPRSTDVSLSYSITITTEYSNLCSFIASLRRDLGYTLVKSIRVERTADTASALLSVTLETAHFAFDASPVPLVDATVPEGAGQ